MSELAQWLSSGDQVSGISSGALCFPNCLLGACISFSHSSSSAPTPRLSPLHLQGGRPAHLSRPAPPPSGVPTAGWSLKSVSLSPRLPCLSLSSMGLGLAMFSVNPACHCCPLWAPTLFIFSSHDWHSSLHGSSTQQVFRVEFSFFSLTKVYLIRLMVSNDTSLWEIEPAISLKNQSLRFFTTWKLRGFATFSQASGDPGSPQTPSHPHRRSTQHTHQHGHQRHTPRHLVQGSVNYSKNWIQP